MDKMKVLWTHNFDPTIKNSGIFMNILAQSMLDLGVELDLCYLGNLRSVKNLLNAYSKVKNISKNYNLVHSQFGSACALATLGAEDTPKILSLRGSDWHCYKEKIGFCMFHGIMANTMSRMSLKYYDLIITMSQRMSNEVTNYSPLSSVVSLVDGINLKSFQPIDKYTARAKLGFPDDKTKWVLFTTMSTDNPIKRVPLAMESVKRAKQIMPEITLKIATGIPHSKMPLFVGACDLILSTSTHEGWPNCIKEAFACNIPFVSTDVSDLSIIAKKEPSCRVCPPDPNILADNICEVLSLNYSKNLRHYVEFMDSAIISETLLQLYKQIISRYKK